jgi:hypothetical protein
MALATGGFSTYGAAGNREDLTDVIYDISPIDTPFMTAAGRGKATAVLHEWQTDALASTDTTNAFLEGGEFAGTASTATTRVQNYCQISGKEIVITGTQEVVDKAGRGSELSYQVAKHGKELKRDMEAILTNVQGQNAGGTTQARKTRALGSWISTNDSRQTSGTTGLAAASATQAPTDGTQRAFLESYLTTVLQSCYTSGGEPSQLMVGPYNKTVVSGFTGRSSSQQIVNEDTILGAAHLYASDFGDIRIVPNRFQRERDAWLIDPKHVKVAYLRPFFTKKIGTTGDSEKRLMIAEYCLEMCNEAAHGGIVDLTAS